MSELPSLLEEVELELETEPHLVVALERNRGWLALLHHIKKRRDGKERVLLHAIMSPAPVDQRKVDYERGYFDALDWMTGLPERMKARLREGGESAE